MSRRAAFDPSRLDDELDELLPPPQSRPGDRRPAEPAAAAAPSPIPAPKPALQPPMQPAPAGGRVSRGGGGRPVGSTVAARPTGPLVSAVRIPAPLFNAIVHDLLGTRIERPSYAQIVAWTCQDHHGDVVAELQHADSATAARAPRGRKLATNAVAMTLRFQPDEQRLLDDVVTEAGPAGSITRTAAVIAALRVAVKHGLPAAE